MLILSCLAAMIGSLCNYAVQALKQSRNFAHAAASGQGVDSLSSTMISPSFGHRRVFCSFSATVVTGVSLGFASFLACAAGLMVFPNLVEIGTQAGYEKSACLASLISLVVALFPDGALLFIENRVNNASQLAAIAARQVQAGRFPLSAAAPPNVSPPTPPTPPTPPDAQGTSGSPPTPLAG